MSYSVKQNVLQTVALVKQYGIRHIVLSPGSRNAPLLQSFSADEAFTCHVVVDERNAAFYALGIIQCTGEPVVVCCTSGTAVLNIAPAVAEAYYQQLPLVVVSADRSPEWIGQMDGQTIPQPGAFGAMAKKSVNLPEAKDDNELWLCNRLINEALIACTQNACGPVHINIPIGEPLFDYSVEQLPQVRKIHFAPVSKTVDIKPFADVWQQSGKKMIIVGQHVKSTELLEALENLVQKSDCVIFTEYLANCVSPHFVSNFDAWLYAMSDEEKPDFAPDLVVTLGGHTVSKRIKQFLRANRPAHHWHISQSGEVADLFLSLTDLIESNHIDFIEKLYDNTVEEKERPYQSLWQSASQGIEEPDGDTPFSDIQAVGSFLKHLPENSALHLANSSTVRNVQLYRQDPTISVFCNRGTNGIESSLPSAIGFASVYEGITYLMIGDLSFFYGLNSLWNISHIKNLRILLINNGGGGIFHLLPGLGKAPSLRQYVAATHHTDARGWAEAADFRYMEASDKEGLEEALPLFVDGRMDKSVILEVKTDMEISKKAFKEYFHNLKK